MMDDDMHYSIPILINNVDYFFVYLVCVSFMDLWTTAGWSRLLFLGKIVGSIIINII
jgi:hypothetical protein